MINDRPLCPPYRIMAGTPHPCAELPRNTKHLADDYGIRVKKRKIEVNRADYAWTEMAHSTGWDLEESAAGVSYVPFHLYTGTLAAPPSGVGRVGDVYIDTKSCSVAARLARGWSEWRGPVPAGDTSTLKLKGYDELADDKGVLALAHPELRGCDRYFWCDGANVGWFAGAKFKWMRSRTSGMRLAESSIQAGRTLVKRMLEEWNRNAEKGEKGKKRRRGQMDEPHADQAYKRARMGDIPPGCGPTGDRSAIPSKSVAVNDVMQAFGKVMGQALTNHSGDALQVAQVKARTLERQIPELQLQHVMELNKLKNELETALERSEGLVRENKRLEEQLWIEAECHKKTQKRYDKLQGKVQRMHEAMHTLFPELQQEAAGEQES